MSFSPEFTITNAITAGLTKIERARGFLDAARLSNDWISEMQNRALVLEAHHTTHIEGTHLTLEQSEKLMAGKKVPGEKVPGTFLLARPRLRRTARHCKETLKCL